MDLGLADSAAVVGRTQQVILAAATDLTERGSPDEIGPVVALLASRRNSYMTGANVNVDGGSDFT
jgi:3-oxoacyl-[acyl-carrier protein] reductase